MSVPIGPKPPRGEDLPCDDGEPLETERHLAQMIVLIESLADAWRDRTDFYVGGNMGLYFSETQARRNDFRAPDVFVVLDTDRHERKRWVVWEEDGRTPDVVVEIVSESTEDVDRGEKMRVYERLLKVTTYVIYDPFSARLDAYRLDSARRRYAPIEPNARGFVRCDPLGLWLGVWVGKRLHIEAPWLRWFDDDGEMLLEERDLLAQESERAAKAEGEVARLCEELERRGR